MASEMMTEALLSALLKTMEQQSWSIFGRAPQASDSFGLSAQALEMMFAQPSALGADAVDQEVSAIESEVGAPDPLFDTQQSGPPPSDPTFSFGVIDESSDDDTST